MTADTSRTSHTIAVRAVLLALGCLTLLVAYTVISRIGFPWEIRWMEGGILDIVLHLREGGTLYGPPTWEFTPLIYMPLYYWFSVLVSYVTGPDFFALRLVSVVSTIAAAWLTGLIAAKETDSKQAGWIAALLYIGAYKVSGYYFDLARIDALWVALLLGYYYTARNCPSFAGQLCAAAIATLAFFTKQATALYALPIVLYLFFTQPSPQRYITPVSGMVMALAGLAALYISTDGWFMYYIFELPLGHQYQWHKLPGIIGNHFIIEFPFILLLALLGFAKGTQTSERSYWYGLLIFTTITVATLTHYMHTGSAPNVLMPLHAGCAILAAIALSRLQDQQKLYVAAALLLIAQSALFSFNPAGIIPGDDKTERNQQLLACIEKLDGPVLITGTGYLSRLAGIAPSATEPAIADVFRTGVNETNQGMLTDFMARTNREYYKAVFLKVQLQRELSSTLEKTYIPLGFNFDINDTAGAYQSNYVWVSKRFADEHPELMPAEDEFFCEPG